MDKEIFDERLLYYGLDDFVCNRKLIRKVFKEKSIKEQYIYKLYVYSRPFIKETWKDYIWDFLQGDIEEPIFIHEYTIYKKRHR